MDAEPVLRRDGHPKRGRQLPKVREIGRRPPVLLCQLSVGRVVQCFFLFACLSRLGLARVVANVMALALA